MMQLLPVFLKTATRDTPRLLRQGPLWRRCRRTIWLKWFVGGDALQKENWVKNKSDVVFVCSWRESDVRIARYLLLKCCIVFCTSAFFWGHVLKRLDLFVWMKLSTFAYCLQHVFSSSGDTYTSVYCFCMVYFIYIPDCYVCMHKIAQYMHHIYLTKQYVWFDICSSALSRIAGSSAKRHSCVWLTLRCLLVLKLLVGCPLADSVRERGPVIRYHLPYWHTHPY